MRLIELTAVVVIVFSISGTAGAADCNQAGNLVSNCDFTTDLTDWSLFYGDFWSHQGSDGATALGSVEINAQNLGGTEHRGRIDSSCQPFSEGISWDWGFSAKLVGGGTETRCDIRANFYSGAACTGYISSSSSGPGGISQIDSTWREGFADDLGNSPGGTQSVTFTVFCVNDTTDFVVRIDDALFGQGLIPVELMVFSVE